MLHTSKGRRSATTTAVQPTDGSLSKIFNYNDNAVTFRTIDGSLMVNATQMAKPFGKRAVDWLCLPSTKAFIMALIDMRAQNLNVRKSHIEKRRALNIRELRTNNFVKTTRGGRNGGGTYLHEDIAIEFARWLSPAFAVWCNDRIKELFRQSITQPIPQEQPRVNSLDDALMTLRESAELVTALKAERAERERLEAVLSSVKRLIDGLPSKSKTYKDTQIQLFKTR